MDAITIYAICATVIAVVATTGFYVARNLLLELCDIEQEDWLLVRAILRKKIRKGKP